MTLSMFFALCTCDFTRRYQYPSICAPRWESVRRRSTDSTSRQRFSWLTPTGNLPSFPTIWRSSLGVRCVKFCFCHGDVIWPLARARPSYNFDSRFSFSWILNKFLGFSGSSLVLSHLLDLFFSCWISLVDHWLIITIKLPFQINFHENAKKLLEETYANMKK